MALGYSPVLEEPKKDILLLIINAIMETLIVIL
jgi:hypothetical protein